VQTISQDRDRYLWFGTQEGLVRFDGVRFHVLSTRSQPALPGNNIRAILEGHDAALWIGTRGNGLARMSNGEVLTIRGAGLDNAQVRTVLDDGIGTVWVGTRGHGLFRAPVDGDLATAEPRLPSSMILDLELHRDGALWVATEGDGVCRLTGVS
jgi:ligand-binding sensor domain-containing protein